MIQLVCQKEVVPGYQDSKPNWTSEIFLAESSLTASPSSSPLPVVMVRPSLFHPALFVSSVSIPSNPWHSIHDSTVSPYCIIPELFTCQGLCRGKHFILLISISIWISVHFREMDRQLQILPHHQHSFFMNKSVRFHPQLLMDREMDQGKVKKPIKEWNHHKQLNNLFLLVWFPLLSPWQETWILTQSGSQVEHRLFVLILNTIRSCN